MFDKVFILQTSKEECFRRSTKRKQDPSTSSIYHEEDAPPPEDPKIAEKLVPYFGPYASEEEMIQKLDSNHIQASENEPALTSFMQLFGNLARRAAGDPVRCSIFEEHSYRIKDECTGRRPGRPRQTWANYLQGHAVKAAGDLHTLVEIWNRTSAKEWERAINGYIGSLSNR